MFQEACITKKELSLSPVASGQLKGRKRLRDMAKRQRGCFLRMPSGHLKQRKGNLKR